MYAFGAVRRNANLVDLEKNVFNAPILAIDTAENEPSKVSQQWGVLSGSDRGHAVREPLPAEFRKCLDAISLVSTLKQFQQWSEF